MSRKHILVISQYFYPEPFRINDMCCEWVKRGYNVTVLTGIPNYPEGRFYDGYGYKRKRREQWNGVNIIRIPITPRRHNPISLFINYFSFVVSGFFWKIITKIKADFVFTYEVSPMTQALIGKWYSKKHKIPNYLYVQDLWPENVETVTGLHSPVIIKPIRKMVDNIYKSCTDIFATSPSFVTEIGKRVSDKQKVHYWPQYAEDFYRPIPDSTVREIPKSDSFKVIFTGNIGYAQGLNILPKTADLLKDENVQFVIVGDGRYLDEFKKEIEQYGVKQKFILTGRHPAEKIPALLSACDAAFLSFMDTDLFAMTIPAKLQSYMACGMPIVASASGETERIIKEAECGICSPIGNAEKLASAIKELKNLDLSQMRQNSLSYFEKNFNKNHLMDKMDKYFCQ